MNGDRPRIFTLVACPMIGTFGPDTKIVEREPCETCETEYPDEVTFLDYQFDTWEQAELVKADTTTYAMARRLYERFQAAGVRGLAMRPMKISRSKIFADLDPDQKMMIPEFVQWLIPGKADGPSGWWEPAGLCPTCGRTTWKSTPRVRDALFAKYSQKAGPPRLVSAATWQGEDAFFLTDPGPPLVTERFKSVAEQEKVSELILDPAEWVE